MLATGCTGDPAGPEDGETGTGTSSADEGGESAGEGSSESGTTETEETSASEGEETGASEGETGAPEGTCPEGADLQLGSCDAQGDTCTEPDWDCSCLCNCGSPEPGEPGNWNCDYAREDELVLVDSAEVFIDCDAGTISGTAEFTLDNVDGWTDVEVTNVGLFGMMLTAPGSDTEEPCGGLCLECEDSDPVLVASGTTEPFSREFLPAQCGQDDTQANLCSYCGGTASITQYWSVSSSGLFGTAGGPLTDVPITCR